MSTPIPFVDLNYIAGFFDGEGSVFLRKNQKEVGLHFCNTNKDVLDAIKYSLGMGNVYFHHYKNRQYYTLQIGKHQHVLKIARELVNRTIVKKSALQNLIDFIQKKNWVYERSDVDLQKEPLIDLYIKKGFGCRRIANMIGCSTSLVLKKLKEFEIPIKPQPKQLRGVGK